MSNKIVFPSDKELFPKFFAPDFNPKGVGFTSMRHSIYTGIERDKHYKQELKGEVSLGREGAAKLLENIQKNVRWFSLLAFTPISDILLSEILRSPDSFPDKGVLVDAVEYRGETSRYYFRLLDHMDALVTALENEQKSEDRKTFVEQEGRFRKSGLYEVFSPIYRGANFTTKDEARGWVKSVIVVLVLTVLLIAGFFIFKQKPDLIGPIGIMLMPMCALGGFGGIFLTLCLTVVAFSQKNEAKKAYAIAKEAEPHLQKAHRVLRYLILWADYAGKSPLVADGPALTPCLQRLQQTMDKVVNMLNSGN